MDGIRKRQRILYITYDGLTDPLGQSQILPYLCGLADNGYAITIVSFEKRDRYRRESAIVQGIVNKAAITWEPLFFTAKPPVLAKIYDRFRMRQKVVRLYKTEQYHLIHCRSYVPAEMGLFLKQKFGTKFLFDMRGFWADEKVDNGQWDLKKVLYRNIYRHYKKQEKAFLLQADGVISLTHAAKDYLLAQPPYKELAINVIPCCADLKHFDYNNIDSSKVETLRQQLKIEADAKVMVYLGSIGGWYMTKEMFLFFKILHDRHPEFLMLVLTKDDVTIVKKQASEAGVPAEKVRVSYAARKELPHYLALCSHSIFFIRNTFSKTASSPTKHAELMGMGIPVICNTIGDTGNIIKATNTGMLVDAFDKPGLESRIAEVLALKQISKAHIRKSALELFDLESGIQKYREVYKRLLS